MINLTTTYRQIFNESGTSLSLVDLESIIGLPPSELKLLLYMYIQSSFNNPFHLSSKDLCEACKISRPTYIKAFQNLIAAGYLVDYHDNTYGLTIHAGE